MESVVATLAIIAAGAALGLWSHRHRPQPQGTTVAHEGETYTRQPNGRFVTSAGALVTSGALLTALDATPEAQKRRNEGADYTTGNACSGGPDSGALGCSDGGGSDGGGGCD